MQIADLSKVNRVIVAEKTRVPETGRDLCDHAARDDQGVAPRSTSPTTRRLICPKRSPTPISRCTTKRCRASTGRSCAGSERSTPSAAAISAWATGFGTFGTMGFGRWQLYTAKYFGPDAKAKIEALVPQSDGRLSRAPRKARLDGRRQRKPKRSRSSTLTTSRSAIPIIRAIIRNVVITDDDLVGDVRARGRRRLGISMSGRILALSTAAIGA